MWRKLNSKDTIGLRTYLTITVRDKRGRKLLEVTQPSRSYLLNFMKALYGLLVATITSEATKVRCTDGYDDPYPYVHLGSDPILMVTSRINDVRYGLVFGSGSTPPSPEDYNLEALIGTSYFYYYPTTVDPPNVSGNDIYIVISRTAENISESNITVSEVGLIAWKRDYSTGYYRFFLIIRDVLDEAVTVPPGKTITAKYTIVVTV